MRHPADATITAVGDQVQALLDSAGISVAGFALLIDCGDGQVAIESRTRIPVAQFAALMIRRYSREIRNDDADT